MAQSMTGFGRFETINEYAQIAVELRCVNHRYLDLNLKISHRLLSFENKIRKLISDSISRGKLDIVISYYPLSEAGVEILYNQSIANMYKERINKIANDLELVNDLSAVKLANMREVLSVQDVVLDEDVILQTVIKTLENALKCLIEQRTAEGERLQEDMLSKLSLLKNYVCRIQEKAPQIIAEYRQKLTDRISELSLDKEIEAQRLAAEVVLYADKVCVDEEIVRLLSHIESFADTLNSQGEIGRKLDFIAQEMNREANTILSKTQDKDISNIGIEIKTLIEKLREQVQNIE